MAELRKEDLWVMADKLRNNMDSAEYKHVCLGLIFLKYISDSFERAYQEISQDEYADPEDRDEYLAKNVFWVPQEARWETIKNSAKDPTIGQVIDNAMYVIEKENSSLRGVLPKDFARASLDKRSLGELLDLLSELEIGNDKNKDTLGSVYEYFLGKFARAEGKLGGEFYTPRIPPKYSVSQFMGYLKGKSAMMIFERHANLKYKFGNRNFWATGYYVSTVGLNTATIQKYIREQEKQDQIEDSLSRKEYTDPFKGSK